MEYKYLNLDSDLEKQAATPILTRILGSLFGQAATKAAPKASDPLLANWGRHLASRGPGAEQESIPFLRRVLTGTGKVRPSQGSDVIIDQAGQIRPPKGIKNVLREMAIGRRGARVEGLRQRYDLGGMFGKGGLLRGSVAPTEGSQQALRRARETLRGGGNIGDAWGRLHGHKMDLLGSGIGTGFIAGFPAHSIYQGLQNNTQGAVGGSLGETLGYSAGSLMGVPGFMVGGTVGRFIGARGHSAPMAPPQQTQPPPMPQQPNFPQPPQPPQMPQYTSPQTNYLRHSAQSITTPPHWEASTQTQQRHPGFTQHLPTPHPTQGRW